MFTSEVYKHVMKMIALFAFVLFAGIIPAIGQTATRPNNANLAAQAEQVVKDLAAGHFGAVEERFDAQMAKDLPYDRLSSLWKEFTAQAGPFERVKANEVTSEFGVYHTVAMTCAFKSAKEADALVTFGEAGHIAGLYFGPQPTETAEGWTAPPYAHPDRFHEEVVTVSHGPWHLPGTLTLPKGTGPFPAVLLVPGSPPVDQDVTVGANKLFKDLAWGLASRGIAVLRYTKRTHQFGAGLGGGQVASFTLHEELIDDARAAVTLLLARRELDHQQTYLLGHSLGGLAVPQMAADDPRIAGIVVMGTPSGDLLTNLVRRFEDAVSEGGEAGQQAASVIPAFKKLRDGGLASGDTVDLFGERAPVGYWLDLRKYEPEAIVAKLKARALILVGGHDAEVPSDDFEVWKSALAGCPNAAVKFYPDLFHLFMPSTATQKGKDSQDDWSRPGHVTPEVVDNVASWVLSKELCLFSPMSAGSAADRRSLRAGAGIYELPRDVFQREVTKLKVSGVADFEHEALVF